MFFNWFEKHSPHAYLIRDKTIANHSLVLCVLPCLSPFSVCRFALSLLYCVKMLTFVVTTLVWFSDNTYISSKNSFSICLSILSALTEFFKGEIEHDKNDFRQAISFYTEGIELKCRDDKLNAKLYFWRAHSNGHLGELTQLSIFCFTLAS